MRTRRFLIQMMMMAVLAVGTAGVMPATTCTGGGCSVPNISTYAEQPSNGNPFDIVWGTVWTWFESVVLPIL